MGITKKDESIWINGIKMNAINLAQCLMNSEHNHNVHLINSKSEVDLGKCDWDTERFPIHNIRDIDNLNLDLLILLGGQIADKEILALKDKGCKVIFYKCGNEYIITTENIIFNKDRPGAAYYSDLYDAFWIIPQLYKSCKSFMNVMHNTEVQEVPFIWHPMHIDRFVSAQGYENGGRYQPELRPKKISIMEPNLNVLKTCITPLLIAEIFYRKYPASIQDVSVTNAIKISKNREFVGIAKKLKLFQEKKLFVEARYATPMFLAEHTDVVISHQWENPLNYSYLDALYMGYPLVHNAEFVEDMGYFYYDFDAEYGAEMLSTAIKSHDNKIDEYESRTKEGLWGFNADNPELIKQYDELIVNLMEN